MREEKRAFRIFEVAEIPMLRKYADITSFHRINLQRSWGSAPARFAVGSKSVESPRDRLAYCCR